uniref:diaminobutyrate acetyltransferase n=1 Tax=Candidatus Neomicrothrix sp. TaxID=2719034 RepID=UPI002592A558
PYQVAQTPQSGPYQLAHDNPNSPYAYLMLGEFFSDTCAVAVFDDQLIGFVTGFRLPTDPEPLFIWQIAVADSARGSGLGGRLLDEVANRPSPPRIRHLAATVTPDNEASDRLFRAFADRWGAACEVEELFEDGDFPPGDHAPELRYRIGPL